VNPLSPLLTALAGLFAAENRPGSLAAARALLAAAKTNTPLKEAAPPAMAAALETTLAESPHPLAPLIRDAARYLYWQDCGLNGRIRDTLASNMMMAEILAPDGLFPANDLRAGLWLQRPQLTYPTRSHPAEETFVILGGQAIWQMGDGAQYSAGCGEMVFHPSHIKHSTRTKDVALLAAWRWSGDISFERYSLKG
jgi:mannose-6-phosphate isomerase-like protein (cupin superfamily)